MKIITSTNNQLIKTIRKINRKKNRDEFNVFYAEGIHVVAEALSSSAKIQQIIFCDELLTSQFGTNIIKEADHLDVELVSATKEAFISFAQKDGPQGIAALIEKDIKPFTEDVKLQNVYVGLEKVQDPGNLGAIMRTCDAMGGKGIILLDNHTDPYHYRSVRASTGAIFRQQIFQTSFEVFKSWKNSNEIQIVGAFCGSAAHYREVKYQKNCIVLMGSEQKGLPDKYLNLCDTLITIPMIGKVDSLNLACATSIVLYEILEQRLNYDKHNKRRSNPTM